MKTRLSNGRFAKQIAAQDTDLELKVVSNRGFLGELYLILKIFNRIWQLLPYFLLLYISWRYLGFNKKIGLILMEMICGEGCSCSCLAESVANGSDSKKGF